MEFYRLNLINKDEILFFENKTEFTNWLEVNHQSSSEILLGFHKNKSKKVSITWSESVDCPLAFGWIDGIRKTIDEDSYKIRYTPHRLITAWEEKDMLRPQFF